MSTILEIKEHLHLEDIVAHRVELYKAGHHLKGLCPFHSEKTPSFFVFPDEQRWHCFGCGKGGDLFDFVMQSEGLDFWTALNEMASLAGLEVTPLSDRQRARIQERRTREEILDAAVRYFQRCFPGSPAERYVIDERGWTTTSVDDKGKEIPGTIQKAGLGYYDGDVSALRAVLTAARIDPGHPLAQAVLKTPGKMLIYPHRWLSRIIYYSCRSIEGKAHWNLPTEEAGKKQPMFNWLWRATGDRVVVVEGQGDAESLGQLEVPAMAAAGCGSPHHDDWFVAELKRISNVILGFDDDEAGRKAVAQWTAALMAEGLTAAQIRVVTWPKLQEKDKDANDWLRAGATPKEADELLKKSDPWIQLLIRRVPREDSDERETALQELFAAMTTLDNFALLRWKENVLSALSMKATTFEDMLRVARHNAGLDSTGMPVYEVIAGQICRKNHDRFGGESTIPLCNFDARIVADIEVDDGELQTRYLEVEGKLNDGTLLHLIKVEAAEFTQMNWILPKWGSRAALAAGSSTKDHLRTALQTLSREVEMIHQYAHTGWTRIDGRMAYISADGAVGLDGVAVALPTDLKDYRMPIPPQNVEDAMKASLGFLDVADHKVTMPLWGLIYLTPLASIVPPSFTFWLFGTTGTMKSTITALAMSHFGRFNYNTPPASWNDTEFSLERKAFLLKDCLLWIDDYTTQNTVQGNDDIKKKSDRLLRAWGNRTGRGRGQSNMQLRTTSVPRGAILSTAEQLPPGTSILSRLFAVEIHPGMIQGGLNSKLTRAQDKEAPLYSHAMGGYLLWLSSNYARLEKELPERVRLYIEAAQNKGAHMRLPANVAVVFLGFEMGLEYAKAIGVLNEEQFEALRDECWDLLLNIGNQQHQVVVEAQPVDMYMSALQQMLAQGTAYLRHRDGGTAPDWPPVERRTANAAFLGWYDAKYLYLIPDTSFSTIWQFYRAGGVVFPDSERGLRAKLRERGMLHTNESEGNKGTWLFRTADGVVRVLRIVRPLEEENTGNPHEN